MKDILNNIIDGFRYTKDFWENILGALFVVLLLFIPFLCFYLINIGYGIPLLIFVVFLTFAIMWYIGRKK